MGYRRRRRQLQQHTLAGLPTKDDLRSTTSEAFRSLRTNIKYYSLDKPLKTILFTSAGPSEGKSFTAANLAVTMAQEGNKVLVLDADLRRPMQHTLFGVSRSKGLTTVISGAAELCQAVSPTGVENLQILTSGPTPPNPSELLGSKKVEQLLAELRQSFDIMVIDSPPVLPVTDAAVIARLVDGVVLVARAGQVTKEAALQAKQRLQKTKARILGVVLNDFDIQQSDYYYYYNYYASEEKKSVSK